MNDALGYGPVYRGNGLLERVLGLFHVFFLDGLAALLDPVAVEGADAFIFYP